MSRRPAMSVAFAIVEVISIMNGRRDAAFLNFWNRDLPRFAGEGDLYHGAYGYRLRSNFGFDQLERAYQTLRDNPESRQVVLGIWDPRIDFPDEHGKPVSPDIPCNICSSLKVRGGKLEWLQVMRSNDLFKGLPYNLIQFTTLQEVMAGWLGLELGSYNHISDSLHLYEEEYELALGYEAGDVVLNPDDLRLPKTESDAVWSEMGRRVDELVAADVPPSRLRELSTLPSYPQGYQNLMCVIVAEAARRRRNVDLAAELMAACTNPVLTRLWSQWSARKKVPTPSDQPTFTKAESA